MATCAHSCVCVCKQEAIQQAVKVISCVLFPTALHTHLTAIKLKVTQPNYFFFLTPSRSPSHMSKHIDLTFAPRLQYPTVSPSVLAPANQER